MFRYPSNLPEDTFRIQRRISKFTGPDQVAMKNKETCIGKPKDTSTFDFLHMVHIILDEGFDIFYWNIRIFF